MVTSYKYLKNFYLLLSTLRANSGGVTDAYNNYKNNNSVITYFTEQTSYCKIAEVKILSFIIKIQEKIVR